MSLLLSLVCCTAIVLCNWLLVIPTSLILLVPNFSLCLYILVGVVLLYHDITTFVWGISVLYLRLCSVK